jgi:hypothetical protein
MLFEHFLLAVIYIIGVLYHVLQKVGKIKEKVNGQFSGVWRIFFKEEWNTLCVSALGLITVQIFWFVAHWKQIPLPEWLHDWGIYFFTLLMGYSLQRKIYQILGTFETVVDKKLGLDPTKDFGGPDQSIKNN